MPTHPTTKNGKPAYRWGEHGKAYTYNPKSPASRAAAKAKADRQGRAIRARGYGG